MRCARAHYREGFIVRQPRPIPAPSLTHPSYPEHETQRSAAEVEASKAATEEAEAKAKKCVRKTRIVEASDVGQLNRDVVSGRNFRWMPAVGDANDAGASEALGVMTPFGVNDDGAELVDSTLNPPSNALSNPPVNPQPSAGEETQRVLRLLSENDDDDGDPAGAKDASLDPSGSLMPGPGPSGGSSVALARSDDLMDVSAAGEPITGEAAYRYDHESLHHAQLRCSREEEPQNSDEGQAEEDEQTKANDATQQRTQQRTQQQHADLLQKERKLELQRERRRLRDRRRRAAVREERERLEALKEDAATADDRVGAEAGAEEASPVPGLAKSVDAKSVIQSVRETGRERRRGKPGKSGSLRSLYEQGGQVLRGKVGGSKPGEGGDGDDGVSGSPEDAARMPPPPPKTVTEEATATVTTTTTTRRVAGGGDDG